MYKKYDAIRAQITISPKLQLSPRWCGYFLRWKRRPHRFFLGSGAHTRRLSSQKISGFSRESIDNRSLGFPPSSFLFLPSSFLSLIPYSSPFLSSPSLSLSFLPFPPRMCFPSLSKGKWAHLPRCSHSHTSIYFVVNTWFLVFLYLLQYPDRKLHDSRASKSVDRRILCSLQTGFLELWNVRPGRQQLAMYTSPVGRVGEREREREDQDKETTLERADFALQLSMFVTAEKEREMFITSFPSSFCRLLSPRF